MMNSKLRFTSSNIVEVIVVVLILVVINYLGYRFFHRIDMTENKQFTISQATKGVLAGLDDPVSVELFLSGDLPPALMPVRDDVRDRLEEYVAYSHGNFKLKITDPGDDETLKQRAAQLGVQEKQIQVANRDELSVKKVFFGLVLSFEDRNETLVTEELADTRSLEYALTSKLVKLTMDHKPKVGLFAGPFVMGQQQQQQAPSYDLIRQVLAGQEGMYEIVPIDAQADRKLPPDLEGLIIAGAFGMSESLRYSIDQFIMNGGQVLVAIDPMMQAQQQGGPNVAYPSLPIIEEQLEEYGVRLNKQLIVDRGLCGQASIPTGFMTIIRDYFLWPDIGPNGFNEDVGAVAQLESLVMPWCWDRRNSGFSGRARGSVNRSRRRPSRNRFVVHRRAGRRFFVIEGVEYQSLARTTEHSFTIPSPFTLDLDQEWDDLNRTAESTGPYDVVAMLEGKLPSAFPDGPPAPKETPEGQDPTVTLTPEFNPEDHVAESKGSGRVIVMTSAIGLSDGFLQQFNQNALFLMNTMDMLLTGEELLGIRTSPVTSRPLKNLTEAQKSFYRWINILGVPVLLVLFGILLWFLKSRRRMAIARRYGGQGGA